MFHVFEKSCEAVKYLENFQSPSSPLKFFLISFPGWTRIRKIFTKSVLWTFPFKSKLIHVKYLSRQSHRTRRITSSIFYSDGNENDFPDSYTSMEKERKTLGQRHSLKCLHSTSYLKNKWCETTSCGFMAQTFLSV